MPNKKITLHPKNSDGQLDVNTNIYPKTTLDNVYTSDGNTPYDDNTFQKALTAGDGISLKEDTIGIDFNSTTFKNILLDSLYPVGAIYTSTEISSDSKCPIEKTLGGNWTRIEDTFLLAAGERYDNGSKGGSADAVVVTHTHNMNLGGGHDHITVSTIHSTDNHNNKILIGELTDGHLMYKEGADKATDKNGIITVSQSKTNYGGGNNTDPRGRFTIDVTHEHLTNTVGGHIHSINSYGDSGKEKNMPPYLVVYVWERVS